MSLTLISSVTKMVSIRKPHIALVAVQLTWSNRLPITSLTKVLKCANLVTLRAANEADVLNLISKRKVSKFLQECCQGTIEWCSITSDAPCISLLRFMCAHVGDFITFLRYCLASKIGDDISLFIVIFHLAFHHCSIHLQSRIDTRCLTVPIHLVLALSESC